MKFYVSSHLVWLYSLVCVGPGRNPRRPVFSERGSNYYRPCYECIVSFLCTGSHNAKTFLKKIIEIKTMTIKTNFIAPSAIEISLMLLLSIGVNARLTSEIP